MAEKFKIVVIPPDGDNGSLSVADAMQQVLDAFELLIASSEPDDSVTWRLVEAKTNSPPFSVVGEARSHHLGIEADLIAKNQKQAFRQNVAKLFDGELPDQWKPSRLNKIAENFIARNQNGIEKTEFVFDDEEIELNKEKASIAIQAFKKPDIAKKEPYSQVGSFEGVILTVSSHYHEPAIKVKDRLSGAEVWCLIDEAHRQQIAEEADFDDVWSERRVRIRGNLSYDQHGKLTKVNVSEIIPISPRKVNISEIKDAEFTAGLSVSEYLEKFREGEID